MVVRRSDAGVMRERWFSGRVWWRFYSGCVAFFRLWLFMLFLLEEVLETIFTPGLVPFALPELKFPPPVLRPLPPPAP